MITKLRRKKEPWQEKKGEPNVMDGGLVFAIERRFQYGTSTSVVLRPFGMRLAHSKLRRVRGVPALNFDLRPRPTLMKSYAATTPLNDTPDPSALSHALSLSLSLCLSPHRR